MFQASGWTVLLCLKYPLPIFQERQEEKEKTCLGQVLSPLSVVFQIMEKIHL